MSLAGLIPFLNHKPQFKKIAFFFLYELPVELGNRTDSQRGQTSARTATSETIDSCGQNK